LEIGVEACRHAQKKPAGGEGMSPRPPAGSWNTQVTPKPSGSGSFFRFGKNVPDPLSAETVLKLFPRTTVRAPTGASLDTCNRCSPLANRFFLANRAADFKS
jgi:hypothetical protein